LIPWSSLPHLPPEISFLPSWLPFSLYTTAAWGRLTVFAFAICRHHKCVRPLPNGLSSNNDFLDELWRNPADKDVPYCAPLWKAWRISINALLLTTIHLVLSFVDILCLPFRRFSRRASVRWILSAQEPAGDWMSYVPTQYMVMLALQDEGFKIEDDSLARGLNAMKRLLWEDKKGKRLQVCPSPTWDTALMIIGMW
jgi:squalene-hopene/tetraprenyl-beta-curcumene cyclase